MQHRIEASRRIELGGRQRVGVHLKCNRDVGVPQPLGHHMDRNARLQQ